MGQDDSAIQKSIERITVTPFHRELSPQSSSFNTIVIESADLKTKSPLQLSQLFRGVQGLSLSQQGGLGQVSSLFIRGAESHHTVFFLNGVKLNDPSNPSRAFDLSSINTEDILRITILKGPQSLLYGSDGLGGVVLIETHRSFDQSQLQIQSMAGSFSTQSLSSSLRYRQQKWKHNFHYSQIQSEGFSAASGSKNLEADGHKEHSLSYNLHREFSNQHILNAYIRYRGADTDLDNGGSAANDDPNHTHSNRQVHSTLQHEGHFFEGQWVSQFSYQTMSTDRRDINRPDSLHSNSLDDHYQGQYQKVSLTQHWHWNSSHVSSVGLEYDQEKAESYYQTENFESLLPQSQAQQHSLFYQSSFEHRSISVSMGLRHDAHSITKGATTHRWQFAYFLPNWHGQLSLNGGSSYKAPSLFQIYSPTYGNKDLKQETSTSYDIGWEQHLFYQRYHYSFHFFQTQFHNLIANTGAQFRFFNVQQSESQGFEWTQRLQWSPRWSFSTFYTYLYSRNLQTRQTLLRRPYHSASFSVNYQPSSRWNTHIFFNHKGDQKDIDAETFQRTQLRAYNTIDLNLQFKWRPRLDFFLHGKNVFNTQYEDVDGYNGQPQTLYIGARGHINI